MPDFLKLKKSNCKNCYKCIRHCPVKSIRFSGNQAHIVGNECILCGQCFVVCPQNAKEIADGLEAVKILTAAGNEVYASLAPSFIANYEGVGINEMRRALRELGFTDAEETAVGAKIVKTEYERLLHEEKKSVLISSCCHSVNLLIQKYFPGMLSCLADVVSPMQAHCLDIKKRHPGAKVVFIGPCVAKKDEAEHYEGIADGVLTFEELSRWLDERKISLSPVTDICSESKTRLFPTSGGIIATMAREEGYTYITVDGVENCIAALKDIEAGKIENCFIEMSACAGSCIGGPVMDRHRSLPVRNRITVENYAGEADFPVEQPEKTELRKHMEFIDKKLKTPGSAEIAAVLAQMGKKRPEDELNCGSCGYNTCREKAIAILQGKADLSMCLPFLKERAESFSDNIINNTPNGIIVLNEKFEIQQINRAALSIINVPKASDVLGEQVVRILDPVDFITVQSTGEDIRNKPVYLAEYNKYVEETIVLDKEYRIIICIMRDITRAENARIKKEELDKSTVEIADKVVEKQMRIVQEIASLLGETAAETKIALAKLKESITDE